MILNIPFSAMIGPVLATVRSLTGESQVVFAERAGVAGNQFSKYERSKTIPDTETAMRLLASGGWRLAAISDDEAGTLVEREAVVEAARKLAAVERGDDASLSGDAALVHVYAAVNGLNDAERAARDAGGPLLTEELVTLRDENVKQHEALVRLREDLDRTQAENGRLRKAGREGCIALASLLGLTVTDKP